MLRMPRFVVMPAATCLLVIALLLHPRGALGANPAVEPVEQRAETHDGFLLRFLLGGGHCYGWRTGSETWMIPCEENSFAGGGSLAAGLSLGEHFHLYLEMNGGYPELFEIGLGLGAYFADSWFIDASGGWGILINFYGAVTFGKEWWVSPQWGMGLALREALVFDVWNQALLINSTLNWTATFN